MPNSPENTIQPAAPIQVNPFYLLKDPALDHLGDEMREAVYLISEWNTQGRAWDTHEFDTSLKAVLRQQGFSVGYLTVNDFNEAFFLLEPNEDKVLAALSARLLDVHLGLNSLAIMNGIDRSMLNDIDQRRFHQVTESAYQRLQDEYEAVTKNLYARYPEQVRQFNLPPLKAEAKVGATVTSLQEVRVKREADAFAENLVNTAINSSLPEYSNNALLTALELSDLVVYIPESGITRAVSCSQVVNAASSQLYHLSRKEDERVISLNFDGHYYEIMYPDTISQEVLSEMLNALGKEMLFNKALEVERGARLLNTPFKKREWEAPEFAVEALSLSLNSSDVKRYNFELGDFLPDSADTVREYGKRELFNMNYSACSKQVLLTFSDEARQQYLITLPDSMPTSGFATLMTDLFNEVQLNHKLMRDSKPEHLVERDNQQTAMANAMLNQMVEDNPDLSDILRRHRGEAVGESAEVIAFKPKR